MELELARRRAGAAASRSVNCASSHASRRTTASDVCPGQLGHRRRGWRRSRPARRRPSSRRASWPSCRGGGSRWARPRLSSRICSYSSGAASRASCQAARSTTFSSSLSSGARQCTRARAHLARARRGRARARRERRRVGLGVHALGHEVPVGVAGEGQRAQHREGGVGVEREEHGALERGVVEQLVDEAGPALLERELRRDVVEHLDARRQAGLHRVLGEDALRERVERGHRGGVELLERERRPRRGDGIGVAGAVVPAPAGSGRAARPPPSR